MESQEEVRMTLEERVREWPEQWRRKGFQQGLQQAREQRREEGRKQGLQEGREQGLQEGREQALEHERGLLRRMAALRFGAETGERAAALMADIGEADRLAEVGDWLVQCGAGDEFLARVASIARS